jgi:hypothetical protein
MKSCSKLSKIFLTAMVHELYKTGMGETTFEKVYFSNFSRKFCVLAFCFGYIWISFHFLTFHKYFKARNLLNSSNIPTGGNLGANFLFLYFFLGQLNSWHPQRI